MWEFERDEKRLSINVGKPFYNYLSFSPFIPPIIVGFLRYMAHMYVFILNTSPLFFNFPPLKFVLIN